MEGHLAASTNRGRYVVNRRRYAVDSSEERELSSGMACEIRLANRWIIGRIEYAGQLYVNMGLQYLGEPPREPAVLDGYYFIATDDGAICGLCVGMQVRVE